MLIEYIEQFTAIVPTAAGSEYEAIKPYLEMAESTLISNLFGESLYTYEESIFPADRLKQNILSMICYQAYRDAIPFVDLIQTPNGFAVVNNGNQAPASKERVERLMEQARVIVQNLKDEFINRVTENAAAYTEWKKWKRFEEYTSCIFLTGTDFCTHLPNPGACKRDALDRYRAEIIYYQKIVCEPVVSRALLEEIISQVRTNAVTEKNQKILYACRVIVGLKIKGDENLLKRFCDLVSTDLDNNSDDYPTYAGSDEYKLKTAALYENKEDDPTFFSI